MSTSRISPAQLTALRLAAIRPIMLRLGQRPSDTLRTSERRWMYPDGITSKSIVTCVCRGWLDCNEKPDGGCRWTLTPAGRAVLDACEVKP